MTTTTLRYTLVDAFTSTPFGGNSCSVIILPQNSPNPLSEKTMQLIAREFNLSETAFLTPLPSHEKSTGESLTFDLRWFTPSVEVKLCGHATLGAAKAVFSNKDEEIKTIYFETLSGRLSTTKLPDGRIEMEFPDGVTESIADNVKPGIQNILSDALGKDTKILDVQQGTGAAFEGWLVVEIDPNVDLANLKVNISKIAELEAAQGFKTAAITTKGTAGVTFLSRFFAPGFGIPEDPVTGSLHCLLGPYWARKLNVKGGEAMIARQVSARVGELEVVWNREKGRCVLRGDSKIMGRGEMYI